ncbi:MAG: divalent-cation tolerance protein CutA [Candidatus Aenigmarchaeota archaeon]|nr:divalent-cation tolerance protein CutA [Candidatus Aenigmarchaeota archaeon]
MRIVLTTCPLKDVEKIRDGVFDAKLVACVLDIPMNESKFWWKGKVGSEKENLLIFKTRKDLVDKLFRRIKELHPYGVPFIAEIDVEKVNEEYEKWLNEVTTK